MDRRLFAAGLVAGVALTVPAVAVADSTPTVRPGPALSLAPGSRLAAPEVRDIVAMVEDLDGGERQTESSTELAYDLSAEVLFGKDSAALTPAATAKLEEIAGTIRERKITGNVQVNGYTDDLGSEQHGLELSQRRAEAVAEVLRARLAGVPVTLVPKGYGEADPLVPNTSEENRRKNRRVRIVLPKPQG